MAEPSSKPQSKPRSLLLRLFRRVLVLALVTYGVWLGACASLETSMVFPRRMTGPVTRDALIPADVERVWLKGDDGVEVEGWFILGLGREATPGPAAMFFHGNAELIDHNYDLAKQYRDRGVSTVLVEYRGYGRTGGKPSEKAIVGDAVKFHAWLAARPEVDPAKIIIHGRSLGSGVAAQVAARVSPAALILESPFTSIASFARSYGAPSFLVRNPFRTDKVLPTLECTILLLHSRSDEIIPFSHAEKLKELAPAAVLVELEGGHNSALSEQGVYWKAIESVINNLLTTPR